MNYRHVGFFIRKNTTVLPLGCKQYNTISTATRQNLCSQKWTIFRKHKKTDFKSSYFFLICVHLLNDATLGCKYSVYIENLKNLCIFSKRINFSII